jgi:hypothetical protein
MGTRVVPSAFRRAEAVRGVGLGLTGALSVLSGVPVLRQGRRWPDQLTSRSVERVGGGLHHRVERDAVAATLDEERLAVVRRAVVAGRRLHIRYAAAGEEARWRTVDPVGLVSAIGHWYLLATRDGPERSYRLSA